LAQATSSASFHALALPNQNTGARFPDGAARQCNGELRLDFNAWRARNGYRFFDLIESHYLV
jgi:hypothetical protein